MLAPQPDEAAAAIARTFPRLSPAKQRNSLAIYCRLAQGRPAGIADIAIEARVDTSQVEAAIRDWLGRICADDAGAVIGYFGLTLSKTRHRLRLDGRDRPLYTWCARDSLFIPMLLGSELDREAPGNVFFCPSPRLGNSAGVRTPCSTATRGS